MAGEGVAERILAGSWERYAREAVAEAGRDHPGRDRVVELFGEPDGFDEVVEPYGVTWPGLAPVPPRSLPDAGREAARVLAALAADDGEERHLLERPYRACDLPALAEERGLGGCWPFGAAEMSAVLGSWEERFGIRLIGLGDDLITVSVAAPARTRAEAEAVAAEHFAFAPDNITQGEDETLRAYAANQVLGAGVWSFWWD